MKWFENLIKNKWNQVNLIKCNIFKKLNVMLNLGGGGEIPAIGVVSVHISNCSDWGWRGRGFIPSRRVIVKPAFSVGEWLLLEFV